MSEAVSTEPSTTSPEAGKHWLDITKRVLVGVVMVLAVLGLLVNRSELVGIWAAYGPARSAVTDVSNTLTQALQVADKGLSRVNGTVQTARQTLAQVNDVTMQMGDRVQTSSPIIAALRQRVDTKLAPVLEQAQTTVMQVTAKIDAPLARIQSLVNPYQAKAIQAEDRVSSTTNTILTLLLVTAVPLTILLIIFMLGLLLLIYVCWQYIRKGRFPSLRIASTM
jgi:hypothetical protein